MKRKIDLKKKAKEKYESERKRVRENTGTIKEMEVKNMNKNPKRIFNQWKNNNKNHFNVECILYNTAVTSTKTKTTKSVENNKPQIRKKRLTMKFEAFKFEEISFFFTSSEDKTRSFLMSDQQRNELKKDQFDDILCQNHIEIMNCSDKNLLFMERFFSLILFNSRLPCYITHSGVHLCNLKTDNNENNNDQNKDEVEEEEKNTEKRISTGGTFDKRKNIEVIHCHQFISKSTRTKDNKEENLKFIKDDKIKYFDENTCILKEILFQNHHNTDICNRSKLINLFQIISKQLKLSKLIEKKFILDLTRIFVTQHEDIDFTLFRICNLIDLFNKLKH